MIKAGDLDRRITFQRRTASQDAVYGTQTTGWESVATVFAQVRDILPSRAEGIDDNISMAQRPARVRIRYRSDITSDMQIVYGSRTLRIISGPAELGRREGLELVAEELSTMGDAP